MARERVWGPEQNAADARRAFATEAAQWQREAQLRVDWREQKRKLRAKIQERFQEIVLDVGLTVEELKEKMQDRESFQRTFRALKEAEKKGVLLTWEETEAMLERRQARREKLYLDMTQASYAKPRWVDEPRPIEIFGGKRRKRRRLPSKSEMSSPKNLLKLKAKIENKNARVFRQTVTDEMAAAALNTEDATITEDER